MFLHRFLAAALVTGVSLVSLSAGAVPGPDSVAVVGNASIEESAALARAYAAARQIPDRQVCLLDIPDTIDLTLEEFRTLVQEPLESCLGEVLPRIEAVVLARGMPLRVSIPAGDAGDQRVSLAAALGVWKSETTAGEPLLGQPPGFSADCGGTSCYAARWRNPYRHGPFQAGWEGTLDGATWRPVLVTMLHGRSYEDAALLIDSALEGELSGGAPGRFLFMDGADPARGALDFTYDAAISGLRSRGFEDVERVEFATDLTGLGLAAFFTGTASLGEAIEGNEFLPGALVDNLTSFGAVPENFSESGQSQVSIARWVAQGVAGVHGTTDEPLNNVFPNRELIVDYVDGYTLAESYFQNLPYGYWRNLVLGDPMAAPYALRPVPALAVGCVDEDGLLHVEAEAEGAEVALFVDGLEVGRAAGLVAAAVEAPAGTRLLAVAQAPEGARSKGWTEVRVEDGAEPCPVDGGAGGGGGGGGSGGEPYVAAGPPPVRDGGCSAAGGGSLLALAVVAGALRRSRL